MITVTIQKPETEFDIIGQKNGCEEHYKTVHDRQTAREETDRLNDVDDGITYDWKQA